VAAVPSSIAEHLDWVVREAALLPDEDRVKALDAAISRLQSAQTEALGDLAAHGGLDSTGCKTVGSWVRLHLRRVTSGYRAVRRSEVLPLLPLFGRALADGEVCEEHVDTVIRWTKTCGLEVVQQHEQTLLTLSQQASAKELDQLLETLADLARPDRDAEMVEALGDRFVKVRAVGDLVQVDAMIEPALGEALKIALEQGAKLPPGIRPADDGRSMLERRADAFGEIIMAGIGAGADGQAEHLAQTRVRADIAVSVTLDRLAGIKGAPLAVLEHFGAIPTSAARRLLCDGAIARVILDTAIGLPLDVGRRRRLATRRQRRALRAIFRHCVFPGCEVPYRFCEIHHIDPWAAGGDTDLFLLLPYCWTHHHFVHEGGFTVCRGHDGRLVHRRPDGREIADPQRPLGEAVDQLRLGFGEAFDGGVESPVPPPQPDG
jgi:Domain of unknown function (DUF222)